MDSDRKWKGTSKLGFDDVLCPCFTDSMPPPFKPPLPGIPSWIWTQILSENDQKMLLNADFSWCCLAFMKGSHFLGGQLQFHPLFQAYFILISGLFRAYFSKTSKIVFFGGEVAISSLISVVSIYASDRGKKRQNYQESITSMMWAYFKLNRGLFLLHYYGLIMALLRPY